VPVRYWFGPTRMDYDGTTVVTRFADGMKTGGGCVPEDSFHAPRLGMTPEEHRLHHELAHHLVGIAVFGAEHSPVLWRAAHSTPQPEGDAGLEEWIVTAVQYASMGRPIHDTRHHPATALAEMEIRGADPFRVARHLRALFEAGRSGAAEEITVSLEESL
jgi:hypothetical protein